MLAAHRKQVLNIATRKFEAQRQGFESFVNIHR